MAQNEASSLLYMMDDLFECIKMNYINSSFETILVQAYTYISKHSLSIAVNDVQMLEEDTGRVVA